MPRGDTPADWAEATQLPSPRGRPRPWLGDSGLWVDLNGPPPRPAADLGAARRFERRRCKHKRGVLNVARSTRFLSVARIDLPSGGHRPGLQSDGENNFAPGTRHPLFDDILYINFAPNCPGFSWFVPALPEWVNLPFAWLRLLILVMAFPVYEFYMRPAQGSRRHGLPRPAFRVGAQGTCWTTCSCHTPRIPSRCFGRPASTSPTCGPTLAWQLCWLRSPCGGAEQSPIGTASGVIGVRLPRRGTFFASLVDYLNRKP